jgi:hypothetical protein
MTMDELITICPGDDQYFLTAPGERCYIVADNASIRDRASGPTHATPFSEGPTESSRFGVAVPFEPREQLLSELLLAFGLYLKPPTDRTAIHYYSKRRTPNQTATECGGRRDRLK